MNVIATALPSVLLLELELRTDARGSFAEIYQAPRYAALGIKADFVQDNWSHSKNNTLRGLHLQARFPQGKLITVLQGHIWDVVADISPSSPTFAQHVAFDLYGRDENKTMHQLWVPAGYAHGFCTLSQTADVHYKCTDVYHSEDDGGILWADPRLNIPWPLEKPLVSERDQQLPTLEQWAQTFAHGQAENGK